MLTRVSFFAFHAEYVLASSHTFSQNYVIGRKFNLVSIQFPLFLCTTKTFAFFFFFSAYLLCLLNKERMNEVRKVSDLWIENKLAVRETCRVSEFEKGGKFKLKEIYPWHENTYQLVFFYFLKWKQQIQIHVGKKRIENLYFCFENV